MLRFDAVGRSSPVGQTVRNESALAFTAVAFRTTADTRSFGTPARPTTRTSSVWRCPIGPSALNPSNGLPRSVRVSSNRSGGRPTKVESMGKVAGYVSDHVDRPGVVVDAHRAVRANLREHEI